MIHIYHGSGKGKTTAALGLAIRMAGHHKKCLIAQFLKDGTSGEIIFLKNQPHIDVQYHYPFTKFYFQMDETEKTKCIIAQQQLWQEVTSSTGYDCIILDEILDVIGLEMISLERVLEFLKENHDTKEIVLTGRNPDARLKELCDYETEMIAKKHPYNQNIPARKGVEY